jgi:methyl-accepting chemotaxis protein
MIAAIQLDTQQAVDAMESTLPRVQQGQALAREATRALGDIQQQAQDSRLKAREVSEANQQQVDSASQLASHVDDMASMAEQTKAATRNNVQAAEQLNSLSDQLRSAMDFFKL